MSTSVHYFSLKSIFISVISQGPSYTYYHSIDNYTPGISERAVQEHTRHMERHFADQSFQDVNYTGTDIQTHSNRKHTNKKYTQKLTNTNLNTEQTRHFYQRRKKISHKT